MRAVVAVDPTELPGPQALVDAGALLELVQALRVHGLERIADVQTRKLYALTRALSVGRWVRTTAPDTDPGDAALAGKLRLFPRLKARLDARALSVVAARKVTHALSKVRQFVDQPDGLIDGQCSAEVIPAVVGHVVELVAQSVLGLHDGHPLLEKLITTTEQICAEGGSDLVQLERAFTLLAEHVPTSMLSDRLDLLVCALLPNLLEKRAAKGEDEAGLSLQRAFDGTGWDVRGKLDLECGELLFTVLAAEARRDEENPADTATAEALRAQGFDPYDPDCTGTFTVPKLEGPVRWPRGRPQRLHDALKNLLQRYLAADLAGVHDKKPVQINVTISSAEPDGAPGALPATAGSGARLPRRLIQRWWCNATTTTFLLSRGWIPLGVQHTGRTLTATERTALDVQGGHRCAGSGCCPGRTDDPLVSLEPHHVNAYSSCGTTNLRESIWACPTLHHDLHHGRTVLLRNGRYLNDKGWADPESPGSHHLPHLLY